MVLVEKAKTEIRRIAAEFLLRQHCARREMSAGEIDERIMATLRKVPYGGSRRAYLQAYEYMNEISAYWRGVGLAKDLTFLESEAGMTKNPRKCKHGKLKKLVKGRICKRRR